MRQHMFSYLAGALCAVVVGSSWCAAQVVTLYDVQREQMVEKQLVESGITSKRVLEVFRTTPRHEFVPWEHRRKAYFDMSLPIGFGQTISSPFIVAYMTEQLDPQPSDKVLEIGTGSGFQAAILSPLVREVYTIEIVEPLAEQAAEVLQRLGYTNVHVKAGDGYLGWPEHAPFDKIIVTCSPEDVPEPLVQQLAEGGRMVIPVGQRYQQTLYLLTKKNGRMVTEALRPTLFVPMTGAAEAERRVAPDPANPRIDNGDFEATLPGKAVPSGWYYQRQLTLRRDGAPSGETYVEFENRTPGRPAQALIGFPIDGRKIRQLEVSFWVRAEDVRRTAGSSSYPSVGIGFFNENRAHIGEHAIGPLVGTFPWREEKAVIDVPSDAREALLGIGLLGAVGKMAFDRVEISPVRRD